MAEQFSANPIRGHAPNKSSQRPEKKKRPRYRSRSRRVATTLIKIVVLAYATVIGAMVMMEPRLVYTGAFDNSGRNTGATTVPSGAESPGFGIQSVQYKSSDGVVLNGRLIERPGSENVVLFFHGNGGRAARLDSWLKTLSETFDASAMVAEYRGYEDDVTPTEKGVINDAFAARDYLCKRYDRNPEQIILYGRSLGGGCAVAVASMDGAQVLILERTFDRMVDVAANRYPVLPVRYLMRNRYDSIAKITGYKGPLIQLHGTADKIVSIEHGRRLFESAPCEPKHWIEVKGLGHNGGIPPESVTEMGAKVREFTSRP
jgi:fermentation-respiration switch protein FrsA (DUF1100 family)